MHSRAKYSFLIGSLLVVALFYPSSLFRAADALNTQDIMRLNGNAEVLASKVSMSIKNVTEQTDKFGTNQTDSESNNSDPFRTKDNQKIDVQDSPLPIDNDGDEKDQKNKTSAKNTVVSCEKDDEKCKDALEILRNRDSDEREEDNTDVKDEEVSNGDGQGNDEETENESDDKNKADRFKLPIDIPFP